jgi:hypothetical protein
MAVILAAFAAHDSTQLASQTNEHQATLSELFRLYKAQVKEFPESELAGKRDTDPGVINTFLEKHGSDLRIDGQLNDSLMHYAGIARARLAWLHAGKQNPFTYRGNRFEGVHHDDKRAWDILQYHKPDAFFSEMHALALYSGKQALVMFPASHLPGSFWGKSTKPFELLKFLRNLALVKKVTGEYRDAYFPKVSLSCDNDTEWLLGMGIDGREIVSARQKSYLEIDENGARAGSDFVASALKGFTRVKPKPDYILHEPFVCFIGDNRLDTNSDNNVNDWLPLFYGVCYPDCWKKITK